ncbi:hypothetical protein HK405_004236 [Cladochytrium tenue]|nr:hypothetical protein HK405_004236 [Cladochytrium tenue]
MTPPSVRAAPVSPIAQAAPVIPVAPGPGIAQTAAASSAAPASPAGPAAAVDSADPLSPVAGIPAAPKRFFDGVLRDRGVGGASASAREFSVGQAGRYRRPSADSGDRMFVGWHGTPTEANARYIERQIDAEKGKGQEWVGFYVADSPETAFFFAHKEQSAGYICEVYADRASFMQEEKVHNHYCPWHPMEITDTTSAQYIAHVNQLSGTGATAAPAAFGSTSAADADGTRPSSLAAGKVVLPLVVSRIRVFYLNHRLLRAKKKGRHQLVFRAHHIRRLRVTALCKEKAAYVELWRGRSAEPFNFLDIGWKLKELPVSCSNPAAHRGLTP